MIKRRRALLLAALRGAVAMLPLSLAVLPWGMLFGALAIQRGFSAFEAQLFSGIVFGGAVQIVTVELIAEGASLFTVLFSAFVISSRHFLYGLALRGKLSAQPLPWRLGIGFLLTDELFSLSGDHKAYNNRLRLYYALGAGGSFYLAWNLWTALGIVAGSSLPDLTNLGLDFAIAATFIALVVPQIKTLPTFVCVAVAAISSIILSLYQSPMGLIGAASVGMLAGFAVQRWRESL
jgi:4-azaleucine resistance transporter AzlC